jgi:hypothetical protein
VYNEFLARTSGNDGHIITTYTAIGAAGASDVTHRYLSEHSPDRIAIRIPLQEARHISEDRRATLLEEYGDEAETRLEGTPQLGGGTVFARDKINACIRDFSVESIPQWARHLVGIDFGIGHPFAAVHIAWVPDMRDLYVINSFRVSGATPLVHVNRIHQMSDGLRMKCVWPHDGHSRDKGSGKPLAEQYREHGAFMADTHAKNHNTNTNSVEPALQEMREMMDAGKLHIHPCN